MTQTLSLPVSSEEIELDQTEIDSALQDARIKKSIRIDDERKSKLAEEARKIASGPWTSADLWHSALNRANQLIRTETGNPNAEFKMIDWQKPIITALGHYFMNSSEFESLDTKKYNDQDAPFDLNKGLWIFGPPGCGKTLLMDMFRINKRMCYGLVQCSKLAYAFSKEGEHILQPHTEPVENGKIFSSTPFFQPIVGICYNDLGTETIPVSHFGNKVNVMEQVILSTYDRRVPFDQRHITTNLTADQVGELYGNRVKDRIRQMFNIIDIRGKSLRN